MPSAIDARLEELGITLPDAPAPAANYVPYAKAGDLIYISGQVSRDENGFIVGKLGADLGPDEGYRAARHCALALIAQLRAACDGDLDRVVEVIKLTGFVNATPDFTDHPKVINGASDLFAEVFGDRGRHARAAVGCVSLPLGVAVEVEGIFQVS
ncbi:RidA family protein [Amaricoccus solimangrovi]|uniref:RidA family protein n=1 Tax=Amaricoccus solimangrovi TaxID=2589815 RepID=A0A501WEK3_9RHOB|nr:RidA family protein [Amaricoccus solimangrovi]TPE48273.1 RidA family protein [Amaricoccus solimangrovi]